MSKEEEVPEIVTRYIKRWGSAGGKSKSEGKVAASRKNGAAAFPSLEELADVIRENPGKPVKIGPKLAAHMGVSKTGSYTSKWVIDLARAKRHKTWTQT
jgi:hypothetical protein